MESWSYKDALTQFVISKVSRCEEAAEILNPTEFITPSEFETECGTIAVSVIATKPHSTNPDDIHLRVVLVERRAAVTNRKVNPEYAVYMENIEDTIRVGVPCYYTGLYYPLTAEGFNQAIKAFNNRGNVRY